MVIDAEVYLETTELSKRYDDGVLALDGLNLQVHSGEIFILLGANGAGKTTTMMLILGFTEPTHGSVRVMGVDVFEEPLRSKRHLGYVSENVMLYGGFTARQNLEFFARLSGRKRLGPPGCAALLDRVGLDAQAGHKRVREFSKGMRQRLGIAIALLKEPQVVILDEPTSGLDPRGGSEFLEILGELRREGKAVLMSTHDIFRARTVADRIGIMNRGRMVRVLDREEIEKSDLERIYLEYVEV
jgi:ABC-2 type transport system ATP-binding protein